MAGINIALGAGQQYLQGQQQQRELQLTLLKEKLKLQAQQDARIANLKIFQTMQEKGLFKNQNVNVGSNLSMKPIKPGEEGLRERTSIQPLQSMTPKNPLQMMDATNLSGMFNFNNPQQIRADLLKQQAAKLKEQEGIYNLAKTIPQPWVGMRQQGQPRGGPTPQSLIPRQQDIRRALLARGQRERLGPQFPQKKTYLDVLPPVTNEAIAAKKGGWFGIGKESAKPARWNPNEWKVIQNINTHEDLQELKRDMKYYQAKGVDVQRIIDYFITPTGTFKITDKEGKVQEVMKGKIGTL